MGHIFSRQSMIDLYGLEVFNLHLLEVRRLPLMMLPLNMKVNLARQLVVGLALQALSGIVKQENLMFLIIVVRIILVDI